jgi:hypothetical protein
MDTHRFALFRRGLLVSAACCLSIGAYLGMPTGLVDTFSKVGADAQLPLETLAVEQVKVDDDVIAPAHREMRTHNLVRDPSGAAPLPPLRPPHSRSPGQPHHQAIWESRDASASASRATGRDTRERRPGVVRSIRFDDFKHWT